MLCFSRNELITSVHSSRMRPPPCCPCLPTCSASGGGGSSWFLPGVSSWFLPGGGSVPGGVYPSMH